MATAWVDAVRVLAETELAWDEAYACRRAGEALLHRGDGDDRRTAAQVLRRGHAVATRLGAAPDLDAIEALARAARIPLEAAADPGEPSADGARLTRREREVLAHVVAGRTYPEIAGALFLSEKTVSSHISNMLRKTGTANRVALADWARHGGAEPRPRPRGWRSDVPEQAVRGCPQASSPDVGAFKRLGNPRSGASHVTPAPPMVPRHAGDTPKRHPRHPASDASDLRKHTRPDRLSPNCLRSGSQRDKIATTSSGYTDVVRPHVVHTKCRFSTGC